MTPLVIVIAVISGISVVAVGLGVGIGVGLKQSSTSSSSSSSLSQSLLLGRTDATVNGEKIGSTQSSSGRIIGACSDLSGIDSTGFETSVY